MSASLRLLAPLSLWLGLGLIVQPAAAQGSTSTSVGAQPGRTAQVAPAQISIEHRVIPHELSQLHVSNRDHVVWFLRELFSGVAGTDLNGDGDLLDSVPVLHDISSGETQVLDVDAGSAQLGGGHLALVRHEQDSGTDFNGDGDLSDSFLFIQDSQTGALSMRVEADFVEGASGDLVSTFTDVFGGDIRKLYSVSTGVHMEIQARSLIGLDSAGAIYLQWERFAGDLNGDGYTEDHFLTCCTGPGAPLVTSTLPISSVIGWNTDWVFCYDQEFKFSANTSVDVNGDGDISDLVLLVVERATGDSRYVGVVDQNGARQYVMGGRFVYFRNTEGFSGDQNGDGDTDDKFMESIDLGSGQHRVWDFDGLAVASNKGRGLVLIAESNLGVDVSGNGTLTDKIAHVVDHSTGSIRSLGFAGDPREHGYLTDDFAVFELPEVSVGTPLNGDSDLSDNVAISINLETGQERIVPHFLMYLVPPQYPNGTIGMMLHEDNVVDLNGDADADDRTACILKLESEEFTLIQGTGPRHIYEAGGHYVYTLDEHVIGADLNGNGSLSNWVTGIAVIR